MIANNFLEENQLSEIRYESPDGKIVLYEPDIDERRCIKSIVADSSSIDKEGNVRTNVGVKYIREVFRMLVKDGHFIDGYTDEELQEKLNNGNRKIRKLYSEIEGLLFEILDELMCDHIAQLEQINQLMNIANSNTSAENVKKKLLRILKKKNVKISEKELAEHSDDIEYINNLIIRASKK